MAEGIQASGLYNRKQKWAFYPDDSMCITMP